MLQCQAEAEKHASKMQKAHEKEMAAEERNRKRKAREEAKQLKEQNASTNKKQKIDKKLNASAGEAPAGTASARAASTEEQVSKKQKPRGKKASAEAATGEQPSKKQKPGDKKLDVEEPPSYQIGKPMVTPQDVAAAAERLRTRPYLGANGISADPRKQRADENYTCLMEAGIEELEVKVGLGEKKSYTMLPPETPCIPTAGTIGVILTSASFYINKVMLPQDQWPDSFKGLYKVGASCFSWIQSDSCG